jgi:hypothetical protein
MANHLFSFLLLVEPRMEDTSWLLSEYHCRIAQVRSGTIVMSQRIPAYFAQLPLSELDDIVTAAWFMSGHVSIDHQCLVELDVLGAALKLPGGQTRLALQVRDAIRDMGLANPWEAYTSQNFL